MHYFILTIHPEKSPEAFAPVGSLSTSPIGGAHHASPAGERTPLAEASCRPEITQEQGGTDRRVWSVRARDSGVSAGQHLTREEVDHVPTDPLGCRAAAMGRVQPACHGGP